jgi:hypothetical protein
MSDELISLELNFQDDGPQAKQENFTVSLYQQLQQVPGLTIDRVAEVAPDGSRSSGRFLWGPVAGRGWDSGD